MESDVEDADAVGESFGEPAVEFVAVEGIESNVTLRRRAALCGTAVELIWTDETGRSRAQGRTELRKNASSLGNTQTID